MLIIRRLTPLCTSLALFTIFELYFFIPELFVLWLAALLLLLCVSILFLMGTRLITPWSRLRFLAAPVVLIASAACFLLFVSQGSAAHFIALGIAILIFLYLEHLFLYIWIHEHYAPFSLEYTTGAIALLSLFFASSALFAIHALLGVSSGFLVPVMTIVGFMIHAYIFWMNKFPLRANLPLLIVISFITAELFWTISFLPVHFVLLGCLVTITDYAMLEITRASLLKTLTRGILRRLLVLASSLAILLLVTARWRL